MAKLLGGTTIEGLLTVDADIETDEGDVILDSSTNTIDLGVLPTGSGNGLNADLLDGNHAGAFALDGHDHDGSYILESGDTMSGVLTLSDGSQAASRTWVNSNADVPNADYADSAGDSDTVDGEHASAFADAGHTHDGRYYTESESDSNFAASGHLHDGRYILEGGDTMSGVLTLSDGSTAASQSWVNSNADVPNADYADNAGDADTLDGYDANQLGVAQSSASFTSTDTSTDINTTSWTQIPWDVEKNVDAPYTHDSTNSPEQITFDEGGTYQVYVSLGYSSSTTDIRESPGVKFAINGTRRDAIGMGGYIRNESSHDDASTSIMETISVSAGDTLTVQTTEKGSTGVVTLNSQESTLEISSITTRTISQSDADTLDGKQASDFLLSAGGSMTGNLNATDSITVTRGGSQLDSNNSIESNGDWLGIDSNSTGNGVLVGYYNAPEIRLGNGGVTVTANGNDVVTSSDSAYDIQKNGSDTSGVINFKT